MVNCNFKFLLLCFLTLLTTGRGQNAEGEEAARALRQRYPYMVAIRNFNRFDCGGVLIGCHTVLTAAQCVDERHGRDRLPELWLNTYQTESVNNETLIRYPKDVRVHPNFTGDVVDGYDYAILLMEESATGLAAIRTTENSTIQVQVGQQVRMLGFGRPTRTSARSSYLQIAYFDLLDSDACRNEQELILVEDQMLCLEGDMPCSGDQGGPVFRDRGDAYSDQLVGIVSATACDLSSRLSAVPSILQPHVFKWIIETVEELESTLPDRVNPSDFDFDFDPFDAESSLSTPFFSEDLDSVYETTRHC